MRKIFLTLFLVTMCGHAASSQRLDRVEAPIWHVGDTWLYQHFEADPKEIFRTDRDTVKSVTDNLIKLETKRIDKHESPGELEWRAGDEPLQFPVFPGKKWTKDIYRNKKVVGNGTNSAIKWENISTPAGDFDALKLEFKYTRPEGTFTQQLWYAPAVKNFVRISYIDDKGDPTQTMELVSFKLN